MRFTLPEPVLTIPEADRGALTWGNDVLMQVLGVGAFVRVLMPIKLTSGYTTTCGAWLSVHPDDLERAWRVWRAPEYRDLKLSGVMANILPSWPTETYGAPLDAAVVEMEAVPYAVDSSDEFMRRLVWLEPSALSGGRPRRRS